MAKKEKTSLYACVTSCTFDIANEHGEIYQKKFYPISAMEDPANAAMTMGGLEQSRTMLIVPKGEIVCKHFIPYDESAEDDREDQMENPGKYIESERDVTLIAELLVKDGQFKKLDDAREGIKSLDQVDVDSIVEAGADVARELAIKELMERADDDKARRKLFNKILKDNEIKGVFPGADPAALAGRVYDEGLYDKA